MNNFQSSPAAGNSFDTGNADATIVGIWRLGQPLDTGRKTDSGSGIRLNVAQAADGLGSNRWDYVVRRGSVDAASRMRMGSFIAAADAAQHPNLVGVLDGSVDASIPYLVMNRIDGRTLSQMHAATPTIELPIVLWMVRQTAEALTALHAAGWVHGDVKPDHLMVGQDGHVTLIDLGFASPNHLARRGAFRGTPQYAAPETLDGNHAAIAASDVFSLGRLLWETLTWLPLTAPRMIEPVADLAASMLAPVPQERPTAGDVARELLSIEVRTLASHIGPGTTRRAA